MENKKFILEAENIEELAIILRMNGKFFHEMLMSDIKEGFEPNWRIEK